LLILNSFEATSILVVSAGPALSPANPRHCTTECSACYSSDAGEDGLRAPSFLKGCNRARCCAEHNEPDENGFSHLVCGTSAGGYAPLNCCNVDPVRHWLIYLSKLRKFSRTVAATSILEMPK
jgi:hypothetical protein